MSRLLNNGYVNNVPFPKAENLLVNEINWLRNAKVFSNYSFKTYFLPYIKVNSFSFIQETFEKNNTLSDNDQILLDGHLCLTKELLSFINAQKKSYIGCKYNNKNFIEVLKLISIALIDLYLKFF